MIFDQSILAGEAAYLRNAEGQINIIERGEDDTLLEGVLDPIREGVAIEVESLFLQIVRTNILELYNRRTGQNGYLQVAINKEMFPGLFRDPYETRIHNVSGFEDFNHGLSMTGFRAMEVDGIPTLVSTAKESSWVSNVYKMAAPVKLNSAAWDLPSSKHTPGNAFEYDLTLYTWKENQDLGEDPSKVILSSKEKPGGPRVKESLNLDYRIDAYQLEFKAKVKYDAFLRERHVGELDLDSLGRPLLRAVNLLESVSSSHVYYTIPEIIQDSFEHKLFENSGSNPPERFTAILNIAALLTEGESIKLIFKDDDRHLQHIEARVNGRKYIRPPRLDKGK